MNPEQIKEIQARLQQKGLYTGEIDGKMGPATQRAIVLEQQMTPQKSDAEIQLERERLAAEQADKGVARQEKREEAADPWMDTFVPFGSGVVAGGLYGELVNSRWKSANEGRAAALGEIADELGPTEKLTTSQLNRSRAAGAATAAERFAPTNRLMKGANVFGKAASYGVPAGLVFNEFQNYQSRAEDPTLTDTERTANQQIANALLGTATGIGAEGGARALIPITSAGQGKAEMRIQTARNFANRMDEADNRARTAPPQKPVETKPAPQKPTPKRPNLPGTRSDLMQQAKRYNIPGRSNMNAAQLRDAVAEAVKNTPGPRGGAATKLLKSPAFAPIVAGTLAYNMADARADDGSGPSTADKLATAGTAGATAYGANRLLQAIPQSVTTAFSAGAPMLAPQMGADMTDYTPEETAQLRNWTARNLPAVSQFVGGYPKEAYDMAQIPERNPARVYENAYQPGGQPNGYGGQPAQQPDDFDTDIAELQRLLSEMEAEGGQPMPQPQFRVPPPATGPQNRLLAVR